MKKHGPVRRRLILFSALVPVLGVAVLAVLRPEAFVRLDHTVYDAMLRAAGTSPPSDPITIVDIDERSLSTVGQWPWRRDLVATLIERLRAGGAAVVALDIMFAEPDRYAPSRSDSDPTAPTDTDLVLARTLKGGGSDSRIRPDVRGRPQPAVAVHPPSNWHRPDRTARRHRRHARSSLPPMRCAICRSSPSCG